MFLKKDRLAGKKAGRPEKWAGRVAFLYLFSQIHILCSFLLTGITVVCYCDIAGTHIAVVGHHNYPAYPNSQLPATFAHPPPYTQMAEYEQPPIYTPPEVDNSGPSVHPPPSYRPPLGFSSQRDWCIIMVSALLTLQTYTSQTATELPWCKIVFSLRFLSLLCTLVK